MFRILKYWVPEPNELGLNLGWGEPIGDYVGFWGGPIKRYTTHLVQGWKIFLPIGCI